MEINKKRLLFLLLVFIFNKNLFSEIIFKTCLDDKIVEVSLGTAFIESAKLNNQDLTNSCFFDRTFLNKPKKVRILLSELNYQNFEIKKDGYNLHYSFFDRKNNKLMVIGGGFPVPREKMAPFFKLFPDYDILIFDYRGQGLDHSTNWKSLYPSNWLAGLSHKLFGVDLNISRIGTKEEDDLITIIDEVKNRKTYDKVFGLGMCFSSFVFVRALSLYPNLFDKLILDGSWPSLKLVVKKIAKNPSLVCTVHNPHSPIPWLTNKESIQNFLVRFVEKISGTNFNSVDLMQTYLAQVKIPVLFFQSVNDCYCSQEEFENLWQTVRPFKVAIFTQEPHGRNHVWQREVYKDISNLFLEKSPDEFVSLIKNLNVF
ncbi:MAG: alpha/beta hydrolase [Candidatus Babeliales bacterium]